ncbi:MAG: hypothetical protein LUO89_06375 [Methanothrix sp.]|nr:hypothetical protein [Methanothrix sp.]
MTRVKDEAEKRQTTGRMAPDQPVGGIFKRKLGEDSKMGAVAKQIETKMSLQSLIKIKNWEPPDLPVKLTPVSLVLPENLSQEQWAEIGPYLARMRKGFTWGIADWLNFGEARYGETYAQFVDATGLAPEYLAILKYVGGAVDPSRRLESLSFTHHRLVASLEPDEQSRFLAESESRGWGQIELRAAIRSFKREIECKASGEIETEPNMASDTESDLVEGDHVADESADDEQASAPSRENLETRFKHLLQLCRALRSAERSGDAAGANSLRSSLDYFLADNEAGIL